MSDGEDREDDILAIILRRDGTLRYDRMHRDSLEALLPKEALKDPGMEAVVGLCEKEVFHPLREALGNIGMDFFSKSQSALSLMLEATAIDNSRFSVPLAQALKQTLIDLEYRKPKAIEAEMIARDSDGNSKLISEIIDLETSCMCNSGSEEELNECRVTFWKLWEFAWAKRIFEPDNSVIEILEKVYSDNPGLETRAGHRRKLHPPGGIKDPRMET